MRVPSVGSRNTLSCSKLQKPEILVNNYGSHHKPLACPSWIRADGTFTYSINNNKKNGCIPIDVMLRLLS